MKPSELTLAGGPTESGWLQALLVIISGGLHLGMLSAGLGTQADPIGPPRPIEIGIVEEAEPEMAPLPPAEPPPVSSPPIATAHEHAEAQRPTAASASALEAPSEANQALSEPDAAPDVLSELSTGAADFTVGSARTMRLRTSGTTPPMERGPRLRRALAVVELSALGTKPTPPDLSSALRQNYPTAARQLGLNGKATLRARVDADGQVRAVEAVVASAPDFAEACAKTLKTSRWGAPRDNQGNPVATWIRYTCRFEANR